MQHWLVVLSLTAFGDSISVYIGPSPKEKDKKKRKDRREKKYPNNPPPASTESTWGLAGPRSAISRAPDS